MRDINAMPSVIGELAQAVRRGIEQAQNDMSQELRDEVLSRTKMPSEMMLYPADDKYANATQFTAYMESITPSKVKWTGKYTCRGGAKSDYVVFWKKYGISVPYGMFVEWGTGKLGSSTVSTPFATNQFDYSYEPWDMATQQQLQLFGTFGLSAHPHWYPSARAYAPKVSEKLRQRIMENINGHTT